MWVDTIIVGKRVVTPVGERLAAIHIDAATLEHRHEITPYQGRTLRGIVMRTILRGETIYERGKGFTTPRRGQWTRRVLS